MGRGLPPNKRNALNICYEVVTTPCPTLRALSSRGYTVLEAENGFEALRVVEESGQKIDLVVSDVVMPVMDGPTMIRAIRKLRPDLPVLFMSGYAEEQLRKEIDIAEVHFLPKPFSVQQIGDKVGAVLGAAKRKV